ncbi:otoancorin-like [Erpetoichthys calabaricus]|uniref:otoancorin-like n=1 Tax=Erpetoichthys calabaricus TaxID=27687 RepID=UPI002234AA9C|nr:otoancorin-like [Erpetoichthys calabaricus]
MELIYSILDVSKSPAEYDTSLNTASLRQKLFVIITASAARRKRAASCPITPTTQQITDLKEDNSQWTPDQLLCMSTQTFLDTFAILGSVQSFNDQQLAVLKNKSIDALGLPSSYTIEQILALGCLMVGFTPAELQQVSVTSVDILSGINACPNWTVQKRAVLVQRLLNQTGLTVSTMGTVELSGLGNFICGMTAEQIAQMNTTSFRMAVGVLSTVNCSLTVMEELMKKAVSAFGPISTWTPAWVNEIGNIIAGASSTDLQNLNVSLLPMITPTAIALIPPDRFRVLSSDQLRALGPTNAAMVTAEQIAMLNSDQRQGLSESLGVVIPRAANSETSTTTTTVVVPLPLKGGASRLALVGILALLQPLFLLAIAP